MKINWGYKLVISLVIFAGIMATMVTIAMRQNIDLVDKEYYKKELAYQEQIDKMNNSVRNDAISVKVDRENPYIVLDFNVSIEDGDIHLFRPSDASMDKLIPIGIDENGKQKIPYAELASGLWRIKVMTTLMMKMRVIRW